MYLSWVVTRWELEEFPMAAVGGGGRRVGLLERGEVRRSGCELGSGNLDELV